MKFFLPILNRAAIIVAFLGGVQIASAFYDPSQSRWINRDPIGELGGKNLCTFVGNNPITRIDLLGQWQTGGPAWPSLNTIVCDGNGGIKTQLGRCGNRKQTECLKSCMEKHEESHKAEALAADPNICLGKAAGTLVLPSNEAERKASEVAAYQAEVDCLKNLQTPSPPTGCDQIIKDRIKQAERLRDSNK